MVRCATRACDPGAYHQEEGLPAVAGLVRDVTSMDEVCSRMHGRRTLPCLKYPITLPLAWTRSLILTSHFSAGGPIGKYSRVYSAPVSDCLLSLSRGASISKEGNQHGNKFYFPTVSNLQCEGFAPETVLWRAMLFYNEIPD